MGKKNKKDSKGKGKEKTTMKTEKKAEKRLKKELAAKGEVSVCFVFTKSRGKEKCLFQIGENIRNAVSIITSLRYGQYVRNCDDKCPFQKKKNNVCEVWALMLI